MSCIYIKTLVILSRKKTNIIQEVKGVNYALFYCLGGRLVSMQKINCSLVYRFLHGCGLHYIVLSGLSVKQEVKGLMTNYISVHYPG